MKNSFDLIVVGAGPGGMAAAATAAELGLRVCLIDDNPASGGQIWRGNLGEPPSEGCAAAWLARMQNRVSTRYGWRVVTAASSSSSSTLRIEREGETADLHAASLILATGARELFLPFPGSTLPGVYGAGGLHAFVKSGFDISGKRVVVAGTGPLLIAVAAALRKAGAHLVAIVEQASMTRLAKFSFGLLAGHAAKLIDGAHYASVVRGVPYLTASWVREVSGDGRLRSVSIASASRQRVFDADVLAIGYHLVPNIELPQLLNCAIESGFVSVDSLQQTSVPGIYCVGEPTGIGGVDKALIEGQIAAFAAANQPDRAHALFAARHRQAYFVRRLESAFALRDELRALPADETTVCRCEDVAHGELRTCRSWREAKLQTRCGMGPCQGRICSPATQFLYGWQAPLPRPPLFPAPVATLATTLTAKE